MTDQPPRRPTPAVYRRRRLFLLVILIAVFAVILIVVKACSGGTATDAGMSVSASPVVSASASAPVSASPSAAAATSASPTVATCSAESLILTPAVSKATYESAENPVFTLALKNTGDAPCLLELSVSDLHFVVSKDGKPVWRLQDCLSGGSKSIVAFQAGQTQTATYTWQRIRSANGQCETASAQRVTQPGDYEVSASIPGIQGQEVAKFTLK